MFDRKFLFIIFILLFIIVSCSDTIGNKDSSGTIFVSIIPQKFFVDKITDNSLKTEVMVPPGKSPATYEPLPEQIMKLSKADIFFTIGMPFEKSFLPKIRKNLPELNIIDCSEGIEKIHIEEHHHENEAHEEEDNEELDPHIWLSPKLAIIQAAVMRDALIKYLPENKNKYEQGFNNLKKELEDLDLYIKARLGNTESKTFFVYHPTYGYFAKDYGLKQIAIEQGGKEASSQDIQEIIEYARSNNIRTIFVQPEFNIKSARTIAQAINGTVFTTTPLAYDYTDSLKATTDALTK